MALYIYELIYKFYCYFKKQVPAPRQLTLERQLNKSILIGWTAPDCQVIYIAKTLYIKYMRSHVFYLLKRPTRNKEYLLNKSTVFFITARANRNVSRICGWILTNHCPG